MEHQLENTKTSYKEIVEKVVVDTPIIREQEYTYEEAKHICEEYNKYQRRKRPTNPILVEYLEENMDIFTDIVNGLKSRYEHNGFINQMQTYHLVDILVKTMKVEEIHDPDEYDNMDDHENQDFFLSHDL